MPYLDEHVLKKMGFGYLGLNVLISDKASIYGAENIFIGDNSRIDDFCVVSGKVTIGQNVHIAPFCLIAGGTPGITLDDFSGLAYRVSVFAQSDDYSGSSMTNPTVPREYKNELRAPVKIGRHVIVGAGAIICPGVNLELGSAVGAASLVTKSTKPWTIVTGIPARYLKSRKSELLALEQKYLSSES